MLICHGLQAGGSALLQVLPAMIPHLQKVNLDIAMLDAVRLVQFFNDPPCI